MISVTSFAVAADFFPAAPTPLVTFSTIGSTMFSQSKFREVAAWKSTNGAVQRVVEGDNEAVNISQKMMLLPTMSYLSSVE